MTRYPEGTPDLSMGSIAGWGGNAIDTDLQGHGAGRGRYKVAAPRMRLHVGAYGDIRSKDPRLPFLHQVRGFPFLAAVNRCRARREAAAMATAAAGQDHGKTRMEEERRETAVMATSAGSGVHQETRMEEERRETAATTLPPPPQTFARTPGAALGPSSPAPDRAAAVAVPRPAVEELRR